MDPNPVWFAVVFFYDNRVLYSIRVAQQSLFQGYRYGYDVFRAVQQLS